MGTALEQWCDGGRDVQKLEELREMYREWPLFNTVTDNVQMGLSKADMAIASLYAQLTDAKTRGLVFDDILDEFERTVRMVVVP